VCCNRPGSPKSVAISSVPSLVVSRLTFFVIVLTPNAGTDLMASLCRDPARLPDPESLARALREPLLKVFPPALLGRLVTIPYYPLGDDMLRCIVRLQLGLIKKRIETSRKVLFDVADEVAELVVGRCTETESGGRMIAAILTNTMLPELARVFLDSVAQGREVRRVRVGVSGGAFSYAFE